MSAFMWWYCLPLPADNKRQQGSSGRGGQDKKAPRVTLPQPLQLMQPDSTMLSPKLQSPLGSTSAASAAIGQSVASELAGDGCWLVAVLLLCGTARNCTCSVRTRLSTTVPPQRPSSRQIHMVVVGGLYFTKYSLYSSTTELVPSNMLGNSMWAVGQGQPLTWCCKQQLCMPLLAT